MNLGLSPEQEELQRSARAFLARPRTPDLWRSVCELGWPGLAIAERWGGGGGTLLDLAVVYEEVGRALLPAPLTTTVAAALVVERAGGDDQRRRLLPPWLAGKSGVALAAGSEVVARSDGRGLVVDGRVALVADAAGADALVVAAPGSVVVIPARSPGVRIVARATFGGDPQHDVSFDSVAVPAGDVLGRGEGVADAVTRTLLEATALQCVEMAGGARAVLEMTAGYVTDRHQFGRPIGSFQAVQHHVADMATAVDGARLAAWQAVWRCTAGDPAQPEPAHREVAIAKVAANRAYRDVTLTAHQLHGGIGFALEHDLHLWSDRAVATSLTLGTSEDHLAVLGRLVEGGP